MKIKLVFGCNGTCNGSYNNPQLRKVDPELREYRQCQWNFRHDFIGWF